MIAYQEYAAMHADGDVDEFNVYRSRRLAIAHAADLDEECQHCDNHPDAGLFTRIRHETMVRDISLWRIE